ncbi:uncharacterized protein isoform X2 [Choristoneura fumiferana]|uniref:uncharacterized protein isoform X2 n=1 Tax=Choristoneura fumiferana TaxID=7141 RepID=UPI003D15EB1C
MSEQETSGADVANNKAPVLMVEQEQSAGSRHKPFRPTELQDEQPELLHKRSKAPAVPSVADQLKIKPEDTVQEDTNKSEWKEQERGSSEKLKHKHLLSKKSRSKKHDSNTPPETETIALAALGVRDKPIPADVKSISSAVSEPIKPVSKQDDDTIAELRSPKSTRKISEWQDEIKINEHQEIEKVTENEAGDYIEVLTSTDKLRNEEISWSNPEYLGKVHLQMPIEGQVLKLERKASVGPCFRPGMPYEGPTGIKLFVPGKSNRHSAEDFKAVPSGISMKMSKKSLTAQTKSKIDFIEGHCNRSKKGKIDKVNAPKTLREKLDNVWFKIKRSFSNL